MKTVLIVLCTALAFGKNAALVFGKTQLKALPAPSARDRQRQPGPGRGRRLEAIEIEDLSHAKAKRKKAAPRKTAALSGRAQKSERKAGVTPGILRKLDGLVQEFDLGKPLDSKKVGRFFSKQSEDRYRHMKRTLATKTKFLQNFGILQKRLDAYIQSLEAGGAPPTN